MESKCLKEIKFMLTAGSVHIISYTCTILKDFGAVHSKVKSLSLNDICPCRVMSLFHMCTNYTHLPSLELVYWFQAEYYSLFYMWPSGTWVKKTQLL